jgi:hypothetical protein
MDMSVKSDLVADRIILVLPDLIILNAHYFALDLKVVLSIVGLTACCDFS